ncbi:MAG: hypothetical protein K8I03_14550 [Ignavibacteria bacterium]|nr:hypothetical protein [Ignavibacteria bacterium]
MKIYIYILLHLSVTLNVFSQSTSDITLKNSERPQIQLNHIKSKSIWEFHYSKVSEGVLADSGYKSYYYGYDSLGRITEYKKYHVFTDLTVKELYQYDKSDNISKCMRYNSKDDIIEAITYKYSKQGRLKTEIHEAYYNSVRVGVYFTILASVSESELFGTVQDELAIEPRLESYSIIVNITDSDEQNQYIVIGDETDPTSPRYSWEQLSMDTQRGLLAFQGPNRKEHQYISKFISKVSYRYNKSGNLTAREVYNTSNDLIEKETFGYDGSNRKISYTKYNENGKAVSMESYSYDALGRLVESAGVEPGGRITGRLSMAYDENGNLSEKIWYNTLSEINSRFKYKYEGSLLTEETKYRGESEKENHNTYAYDENGNLKEVIKFDINNRKDKLIKYIYEYY